MSIIKRLAGSIVGLLTNTVAMPVSNPFLPAPFIPDPHRAEKRSKGVRVMKRAKLPVPLTRQLRRQKQRLHAKGRELI